VIDLATKVLQIVVPARLYERLVRCSKKSGISKEDLIMRALIKVIEEFEE